MPSWENNLSNTSLSGDSPQKSNLSNETSPRYYSSDKLNLLRDRSKSLHENTTYNHQILPQFDTKTKLKWISHGSTSLNLNISQKQNQSKQRNSSKENFTSKSVSSSGSSTTSSSSSTSTESRSYLRRLGSYFSTTSSNKKIPQHDTTEFDRHSIRQHSYHHRQRAFTVDVDTISNHTYPMQIESVNEFKQNEINRLDNCGKIEDRVSNKSVSDNTVISNCYLKCENNNGICDNLVNLNNSKNSDSDNHNVNGGENESIVIAGGIEEIELNPNKIREEINSFLLPRVLIKTSNNISSSNTSSNDDSGFERCYGSNKYNKTSNQTLHHQQHHQQQQHHHHHPHFVSHYSTEKSGSSGYYGSNLYSTSSFDDHIYSEPVTDSFNSNSNIIVNQNNSKNQNDIEKLPTIMEGIDGLIPRPVWPNNDFDDSLIDVNLDSFLLKNKYQQKSDLGIDNPAYHNTLIRNEFEINNLQHTREILEEICNKLNNLLLEDTVENIDSDSIESNKTTSKNPFHSASQDNGNNNETIKNEIKSLKQDLDEYLKVINKKSEKDIKKLCDNLSKNTKMLTIKKALENRHNTGVSHNHYNFYELFDHFSQPNTYESLLRKNSTLRNYPPNNDVISSSNHTDNSNNFDVVYVQDGYNIEENISSNPTISSNPFNPKYVQRQHSIRSANDPNFHFQFKINTESIHDIHDENEMIRKMASSNADVKTIKNNSLMQNKQNVLKFNGMLDEKNMILDWHKNKPSIWEMYYGKNRPHQTIVKSVRIGKKRKDKRIQSVVSYPSTRPESDFTLDVPRAEQLRIKMRKEKQFRSRCRIIMTFFSLIFFLLTVMSVSLILTRGKRMFGSML